MNRLTNTLEELLNIQGASGEEQQVAKYVTKQLIALGLQVKQDCFGNVLGELTYGDGPTILLSAHMDTVTNFVTGRRILRQDQIIRSSTGILGADDRAGIAIILEVLHNAQQAGLQGTVKVAFTCAEEVGRLGSQHISPIWLKGIDMAVVADRRNRRDIVTSCGRRSFCPSETGEFWAETALSAGLYGWRVCQGGISDALTYAEYDIPSVNLSCGYQNEHTADEELHLPTAVDTAKLVTMGLRRSMKITSPVRYAIYN